VPASPEEVGRRKGYIDDAGLERLIEPIASCDICSGCCWAPGTATICLAHDGSNLLNLG